MPKWSDDDDDVVLRSLWGFAPAKDIAAILGKTKNAVIGRAFRLNLKRLQRVAVARPREIDGVRYGSTAAAARALGVSESAIRLRQGDRK